MNCYRYLIYKLIFLNIIFIILIILDRNKETFIFKNTQIKHENENSLGGFSIVNINDNDPEAYDIEKLGPTCVGQCVAEHGPNILFTNPEGDSNILKWNKDHPTKGFCYRANSNNYPFECDQDCQDVCGKDKNYPDDNQGEYDPNNDFSQCEIDQKSGCIEKQLNFLTGQSCLTTVGCKLCIDKYANNIESINNAFSEEIENSKKCKVDSEEEPPT
jgi:hypothetical protein